MSMSYIRLVPTTRHKILYPICICMTVCTLYSMYCIKCCTVSQAKLFSQNLYFTVQAPLVSHMYLTPTSLSFVLSCTTYYTSFILHVFHLFNHLLFLVHLSCLSLVLSCTTHYSFFTLHVYHLF